MAIIAFLFGSILGFALGVIGWLMLDMHLLYAVGLYFATGFCFVATAYVFSRLCAKPEFEALEEN